MSEGLLIGAVVLLAYGLLVRFAGERRVLNFVDYSAIGRRTDLHRAVGARLLVGALALGVLWLASARLGLPVHVSVVLFIVAMAATASWVVASSSRFDGRGEDG